MFCPNKIIIHCTASHQSNTIADIRKSFLNRGFKDIGYHYIVMPDGDCVCTRSVTEVGAHCIGHNKTSIGVAWLGGLDGSRNITPEQRFSLNCRVVFLFKWLIFDFDTLATHHYYNHGKSCPNYSLDELFPSSTLSMFKYVLQ